MENSITLYKSEFTPSSPRQPYFLTEESRDNYLNSTPSRIINLNQPNIYLGKNLTLNIVVPIDYTLIEEYTLAKIKYNNKEYFIYIIDSEMVSFDNCRLYGHRSVAFECVNYFSKFENFDISKITSENFIFGKNSRFQLPSLKLVQESSEALEYLSNSHIPNSFNFDGAEYELDGIRHCLCIVACVSQSVSKLGSDFIFTVSGLDGLSSGFSNLIIPIRDFSRGNEKQNFKFLYNTFNQGNVISDINNAYYSNKFLEKISPYILNLSYIRLPVFTYHNATNNTEIVRLPYAMKHYSWTYASLGASVEFGALDTRVYPFYDYQLNYEANELQIYGKFTIQLYHEHDINIDLSRYILDSSTPSRINIPLKFYIKYIFDTHGVSIQLQSVLPNDGLVERIESYEEAYVYKISAGVTFFVSSEADFLAQNKYYDAITENETSYIKIKGYLGASSSVATGIYQSGVGMAEMGLSGGTAGWGGISNGGSNIIRGFYQGTETIIDANRYEMQRFYYALNEQSKPDTAKDSVENGYILSSIGLSIIRFIYSEPFSTDFDNFKKRSKVYGIECDIFCSTFNELKAYFMENFSVNMLMYQTSDNHYSNQQNNEIKELTRSGLLYKIFGLENST